MHIVIVGAGIAGITSARVLRENFEDVQVDVYTDESHLYYPRPRLYEILRGEKQPQEIYAYSNDWYQRLGIMMHLNERIIAIDCDRKHVEFQDGEKVGYDKLLLANGAKASRPNIEGVKKRGVFTLRSIDDALAIKEYSKKTTKAIVIGGGLLGLEFAACLRKMSQEVEVVEIHPRLLPLQLDTDGAAILKMHLETLGIGAVLGVQTKEILGEETAEGVALDDGQEIMGELILIAAGISPNIELAANAGIQTRKGVIVDSHLQTSSPDVYAAGDVAEFDGRVYGIIPPSVEQARIAALNMATPTRHIYEGSIHVTTLKVVDLSLTSMGLVTPEGSQYEEIRKVDEEEGVYKKIVLDQGKIVGAILLGDNRGSGILTQLMNGKTDVSRYRNQILENGFDLKRLI